MESGTIVHYYCELCGRPFAEPMEDQGDIALHDDCLYTLPISERRVIKDYYWYLDYPQELPLT